MPLQSGFAVRDLELRLDSIPLYIKHFVQTAHAYGNLERAGPEDDVQEAL